MVFGMRKGCVLFSKKKYFFIYYKYCDYYYYEYGVDGQYVFYVRSFVYKFCCFFQFQ